MKYYVNFSCGHTEMKELFGTTKTIIVYVPKK